MTISEYLIYEGDNIALSNKTVEFGKYYKSSDSIKQPIEWIVLDMKDNKLLLISKDAIDCKRYHESYTEITWEKCSLRKWLNGTFLNIAFTHEEQSKIADTTVTADKNPSFDTPLGNNTTDKIFLLSIPEVKKYFNSDSAGQCRATEYAKAQGTYTLDNDNCLWLLRSPGFAFSGVKFYYDSGFIYDYLGNLVNKGIYADNLVNNGIYAVRPALWINL